MDIKTIFKFLQNGFTRETAQASEVGLPTIPAAVASYIKAKYVPGPHGRVILTLTALPVTLTLNGTSTAGGGVKILSFPKGYIIPASATSNLAVANAGGDGSFVASIGSVSAATDGTLTSTEANFVASTAATVSSNVGTCKFKSGAQSAIDGTGTAVDLYLNAAIGADGTGKATLTFTGTLILDFNNAGATG